MLIFIINKILVYKNIILSEDNFYETPLKYIFKRTSRNFLISIYIINNNEFDKKLIKVEIYKKNGLLIFKFTLLNPNNSFALTEKRN